MDPQQQEVDRLVDLLDQLMENGSGHVNLTSVEGEGVSYRTLNTSACQQGDCACREPTLHQGIDDGDAEEDTP